MQASVIFTRIGYPSKQVLLCHVFTFFIRLNNSIKLLAVFQANLPFFLNFKINMNVFVRLFSTLLTYDITSKGLK